MRDVSTPRARNSACLSQAPRGAAAIRHVVPRGGRSEIEIHAAERRRALHEVGERTRARERSLREQLERDETEARARIAAGLEESERRHLAALDRASSAPPPTQRVREKQFDAQIKESARRRPSACRASSRRRSSSSPARRRRTSPTESPTWRDDADRLQRRINDVARSPRHSTKPPPNASGTSRRLEETLAAAEERQAALEAEWTPRCAASTAIETDFSGEGSS
jgi:hypothetical protein